VNAENKNISATTIVTLARSDIDRMEIFLRLVVMMTFSECKSKCKSIL